MSIEVLCDMSDDELEETLSKCNVEELNCIISDSKEEYNLCMAIENGIYTDEYGNEFFLVGNEIILNEEEGVTGGIDDIIKDANK